MIIISRNYVIVETADFSADNPVIGYENLVTVDNVTVDIEDPNHPAVNVANSSTALKWAGFQDYASQALQVFLNSSEEVDYLAIARHNLGSLQFPVTVEGATELDSDGNPDWFELVQETLLPDDSPAIFRFAPQALLYIRLVMGIGLDAPEISVLYVGKLLILQRRIYVGHTPINYGRNTNVTTGRSESGQYLGRLITGEWRSNGVSIQNITPDWYREFMDPFVARANQDTPFFFAWRPETYPFEVGYCWLTGDARPVNQIANGMMQIELSLNGVS